jgi:hypothetical protein
MIRFLTSMPLYYLVNEGLRRNGINNIFAIIGLSVLIVIVYDLGQEYAK